MKQLGYIRFFLVSLFLFSCSQIQTQEDKASRALSELLKTSHAPGIAVSVGIEDRIVWSEGLGFADLEQRVPVNSAKTKFRIGSVSKTMTAVAIGKLFEQGLLDLDVPVQHYVPTFPQKRFPISTRQLAGHLAGIRHYKGDEFLNAKHYPNVLSGLEFFKNDPLLFEPGEKYAYSSYAWNLISAVVESAADQDFLSYMRDSIFIPMGMVSTIADQVDSLILYRSRYYNLKKDSTQINSPWVDNSYKWAGGGFLSTADDLVRLGFAHLDSGFLTQETIELLWSSQETDSGEKTNYGIGWSSGVDEAGRKWVGHGGGSIGGSTYFRVYPDQKLVISVIANLSGARFRDYPEQIAEIFLENLH